MTLTPVHHKLNETELVQRAAGIRLVVLDVDGVLTDGSIYTGQDGELVKRFYVRDGLGIKMLQAAGIEVAILTGRNSAQTAARAKELGITSVAQGKRFKTDAFHDLLKEHGIDASACCYMGDDVPDIPVIDLAGLATAPADADPLIAERVHWIAPKPGGNGAVRALAELILRAQGKWDQLIYATYVQGKHA